MFTKKYIKKCEKAKELQELWKPKKGDYFYGYEWSDQNTETKKISKFSKKEIHLLYFTGDDWESCFPIGEEIGWHKNKPDLTKSCHLLTLEQLWNMAEFEDYYFIHFEHRTFRLIEGDYNQPWYSSDVYKDIKELLIGEIMRRKYQKRWNGKDWV